MALLNPQTERPNLKDVCEYGGKQDDEFVGIRYEKGALKVYFPSCYSKPEDENDERARRLDILNLVSVLSSYSKESKELSRNPLQNKDEVRFPIHAYIHVFTYFLNDGYYAERTPIYKRGAGGKIDWARTIKQIRPQVAGSSRKSIVYLDYITKRSANDENEIVAQIHRWCVFEAYEKIGCLFAYLRPERPRIAFNAKRFAAVLQSKIARTFNEKHLLLFRNMLDIVCHMGTTQDNDKAVYGTKDFEYVWEGLIDQVFGIKNKKNYFPTCTWRLYRKGEKDEDAEVNWEDEKHTALRPDTIMLSALDDDTAKIFVLDAKYYRHGEDPGGKSGLPATGSILKQIAYAEYIDEMRKVKTTNKKPKFPLGKIYNAFILPYDAHGKSSAVSSDYALECFGHAGCEWKTGKSYHKIYGIFLDVRAIMQRHPQPSDDDIAKLASLIEKKSEEEPAKA